RYLLLHQDTRVMILRILIADDEKAARFGLAKALAQGGHHITEAEDCHSALEAIRTTLPDLVFLDLGMPEGRTALSPGQTGPGGAGAAVRAARGGRRRCEIVVVPANDTIAAAVECMKLGGGDYTTKPYEVEQVRAVARRCGERLALERRVADLQDR